MRCRRPGKAASLCHLPVSSRRIRRGRVHTGPRSIHNAGRRCRIRRRWPAARSPRPAAAGARPWEPPQNVTELHRVVAGEHPFRRQVRKDGVTVRYQHLNAVLGALEGALNDHLRPDSPRRHQRRLVRFARMPEPGGYLVASPGEPHAEASLASRRFEDAPRPRPVEEGERLCHAAHNGEGRVAQSGSRGNVPLPDLVRKTAAASGPAPGQPSSDARHAAG